MTEQPGSTVEPTVLGGHRAFSRRAFLGGAASMTLVAVAVRVDPGVAGAAAQRLGSEHIGLDSVATVQPAPPVLPLVAERDTDLLLADFTFYGFTVDKTSSPASLVATAVQTTDNWIGVVVQLPPQAIGRGRLRLPDQPAGRHPLRPQPGAVPGGGPEPAGLHLHHR